MVFGYPAVRPAPVTPLPSVDHSFPAIRLDTHRCALAAVPCRYQDEAFQTTVSEAHGFGMIIFVTMAGHDVDAQSIFNGMVTYWQAHPSGINPNCTAWKQVRAQH